MSSLPKKIDLTAETTGNLPAARITGYPPISSGDLTVVANAAARLAQTGLAVGDSTIQTDTGVLYLLTALPESSAGNWTVWNPSIAGLTAANVVNVPAGGIAAVTVQAAIDELDTEKGTKVGIQSQSYVTAADTGAADAYALTVNPAISGYATGQRFSFQALNPNTGASTLAVSGLAATAIKKNVTEALTLGDILDNQWIEVVYDGTNFQMVNRAIPNSYVKVTDTKAAATGGGTFTSGAWQVRTINTENSDAGGICAIAANQITLAAGTYECAIRCPAFQVDQHKCRLYNTTAAAIVTDMLGCTAFCPASDATQTDSIIVGRFTIAAAQALEVQHWCRTTRATVGFGAGDFSLDGTSEIYTVAEFWKVA
jgi:hypothetical protein